MPKKKTFQAEFEKMDMARQARLNTVREMALLTCPSVAPEENRTSEKELENPWQDLGKQGIATLAGRFLLGMFPSGIPWFRLIPSARIRSNTLIPPHIYNAIAVRLTTRELITLDKIESTNFRVVQRTLLEDDLVAGASLCHLSDEYRLRRFRYDQWVTHRGSDGQILWYITHEKKDISELTPKQIEQAGIKATVAESDDDVARIKDLYTRIEYQQGSKEWLIKQELEGKPIGEPIQDPVCAYLPSSYRETAGEHYPRSFMDERIDDLRSYNILNKYELDIAEAIAFIMAVADTSKGWQPKDFMRDSGKPIAGSVTGGEVDGLALLQTSKTRDLAGIDAVIQRIETRLGKSMLMLTEALPTGDRVTARAVSGIARELDGATAGAHAHMSEQRQKPLIERFIWQMERDKLLEKLPDDLKEMQSIDILTGVAALTRQQELDNLLGAIQTLSLLPGALDTINLQTVADRVLSGYMIDRKGLLLTPEQVQAKLAQASASELQNAAGQQAISTIGTLIEERAKQQ